MGAENVGEREYVFQNIDTALKRSESWLQTLASNAPVGIYLRDIDGNFRYVNQQWCKMAGMTPDEARENGWINAIHPDDRERVLSEWYQLSITDWGWQQEYRLRTPAGKVTWITGYAAKIRDEQGTVIGYFGINVDITARKGMENALRASEERYRTTIDAMNDGIHVVDDNLKITLNNSTIARWAQEMGLSGILVGKTPFRAFPFLPERVADEYKRVFQTGETLVTEEMSRFANKEKYTETRKTPIFDGGKVSHIVTVMRDITERVEAEETLRENEEKYRLLFETMAQGAFYQRADGKLVDVNSSALEMMGVTRDQFLGRTSYHPDWKVVLGDGTILAPGQHPSMVALQTGKKVEDFELGVYRPNTQDYTWMIVNATPQFRDGEEKPYQVFVTLHDITERKHFEEKLRRQAREMKALQETVLDIVAPHKLSVLLPTIVERAVELLGGSAGGMYLSDPDGQEVRCVVSYNTKHDFTGTVLKYGEGAAGTVAQTGEALIIDDYRTWPGRAAIFEKEQPFLSILSVPLKWQEQVIGVLHVLNNDEEKSFTLADRELLGMFAAHAAMAVGKSQALEQAQTEVVERKRTEEALHKSEASLKEAEKIAKLGYWEWDILTNELTWSEETFRIYGMNPAQGKPTYEIVLETVTQEYREQFAAAVEDAVQRGKHFEGEYQLIGLDGKMRYTHTIGEIIRDSKGNPVKMFGVVQDITERKKIERALQESEARYRALFEQSPDGIVILDPENAQPVEFNDQVCRQLGYTREQFAKLTLNDIDVADTIEETRAHIQRILREGHDDFETRQRTKQGGIRDVHVTAQMIDVAGTSVYHCIWRDITERKRMETNLNEALEDAHLHQKETLALLEAAQAIPLCTTFGQAARKIFDICKELIGAKSGYVALLSEEGIENEVLFLDAGGLPCTVDPELPMPIRGLREVAYRTNDVAFDNDFANSPWIKYMPPGHVALENVLFAPLNIQNETVGLIGIANKPGGFSERDAKLARTFGDLASVGFKFARYQDELREGKERYRLLAENSIDGIALFAADYSPLYISPSTARIAGYSLSEFQSVHVFELVHPDDKEILLRTIQQDVQQKKKNLKHEFRIKRKDGAYIWIETLGTRSFDEQGNVTQMLVNVRDINERKQVELENENLLLEITQQREELRNLNARVAVAEETERRRIAKELHDEIGQNLSALNINLNIIQSQISSESEKLQKRMLDSLKLVGETTDNIRNVMADLYPQVLDDYGLVPALNRLAERARQRSGLSVSVRARNLNEERLDARVEMSLFRITQEAVNNVVRHAGAKNVTIELKQLKNILRLSIIDDGTGFAIEQPTLDKGGWGLRIMRERAESIGGSFRVESARPGPRRAGEAGRGTRVIVELSVK